MRTGFGRRWVFGITGSVFVALTAALVASNRHDEDNIEFLDARVDAAGIPDISFLPGGPIHDNAAFAVYTQPGRVLGPGRILVASSSKFGEPLGNHNQFSGSLLSIYPRGTQSLILPSLFAVAGGQASTLERRVQMYSAQNPAFLNSIHTPSAATANFTGVSHPLGLPINNAFGRLWPANAPYGLAAICSSAILDPTGEPLAGVLSPESGGVYAGDFTSRMPAQVIPGALNTGAVRIALLGGIAEGRFRSSLCRWQRIAGPRVDPRFGLPQRTVCPAPST